MSLNADAVGSPLLQTQVVPGLRFVKLAEVDVDLRDVRVRDAGGLEAPRVVEAAHRLPELAPVGVHHRQEEVGTLVARVDLQRRHELGDGFLEEGQIAGLVPLAIERRACAPVVRLAQRHPHVGGIRPQRALALELRARAFQIAGLPPRLGAGDGALLRAGRRPPGAGNPQQPGDPLAPLAPSAGLRRTGGPEPSEIARRRAVRIDTRVGRGSGSKETLPMTSQAATPPAPALPPVAALLARLALAPRQTHKALTLWPLVLREEAPACDGPGYVSLSRALEDGTLQIDEVGEGGSVPLVRVTNRGGKDVLFLFGEEIRGAKQNRIANASFLVPARGELVIDVSCVEQGRWARRGGGASPAPARSSRTGCE